MSSYSLQELQEKFHPDFKNYGGGLYSLKLDNRIYLSYFEEANEFWLETHYLPENMDHQLSEKEVHKLIKKHITLGNFK